MNKVGQHIHTTVAEWFVLWTTFYFMHIMYFFPFFETSTRIIIIYLSHRFIYEVHTFGFYSRSLRLSLCLSSRPEITANCLPAGGQNVQMIILEFSPIFFPNSSQISTQIRRTVCREAGTCFPWNPPYIIPAICYWGVLHRATMWQFHGRRWQFQSGNSAKYDACIRMERRGGEGKKDRGRGEGQIIQ